MSYKWRIALLLAVLAISLMVEPFIYTMEPMVSKTPKTEEEVKAALLKDPKIRELIEQTKSKK